MAHRQKDKKRQSTAAYAASQPLFDALHAGTQRLEEQRDNLTTARDIVQRTHVKLVNAVPEPVKGVARPKVTTNDHEQYMDAAVKAWRAATESYADIFEALAKVTAAEMSEGRVEREGHVAFAEMAKTASLAKNAASGWTLFEEQRKTGTNSGAGANADDSDSSSESSDSSSESEVVNIKQEKVTEPVSTLPTNPILMSVLGKRPANDAKAEEVKKEHKEETATVQPIEKSSKKRKVTVEAADTPEIATLATGEATMEKSKRSKKREQRRKRNAALGEKQRAQSAQSQDSEVKPKQEETKPEPVTDAATEGSKKKARKDSPTEQQASNAPDVKYQDVSTEVAARLTAKEDKAKAEKAAKREQKRKRESRDSFAEP